MSTLLLIGSCAGAVAGLIHAWGVYTGQAQRSANTLRAVYFALWAVVLWVLFGAYVLYLWLLAAALYLVHVLRGRVVTLGMRRAS